MLITLINSYNVSLLSIDNDNGKLMITSPLKKGKNTIDIKWLASGAYLFKFGEITKEVIITE